MARRTSEVHTVAASPYSVSLAIRTASSSPSNPITDSTGPNISSRAIVMSLDTSANSVGVTKLPAARSPSARVPPHTSRVPSSRPPAIRPRTRSSYPIVASAMGYVSGPRLVTAVSNAGGLGIIASATMSLAELRAAIKETAAGTNGPFGVNIRADAPDARERVAAVNRRGRSRRLLRPRAAAGDHRRAEGRRGGHDRVRGRAGTRRRWRRGASTR
jgi:hypothetical protein